MTDRILNVELPKFRVKLRTLIMWTFTVTAVSIILTVALFFFISWFSFLTLIPAVFFIVWFYIRVDKDMSPSKAQITELRSWAAETYDVELSTRNAERLLTPSSLYDGKNVEMYTSELAFLTNKGIFESRYQADIARLTYLDGRFLLFNPDTGQEYSKKEDYINFTHPVDVLKAPKLLTEKFYPANVLKFQGQSKAGAQQNPEPKSKAVTFLTRIIGLLDFTIFAAVIMGVVGFFTVGFPNGLEPWNGIAFFAFLASILLTALKTKKVQTLKRKQEPAGPKKLFTPDVPYGTQKSATSTYPGDDVYEQTQNWLLKKYGVEFTSVEVKYLVDGIKDTVEFELTPIRVNKQVPLPNGQSYITGVYLLQVTDDDFALMVQDAPVEVIPKALVELVDARIEAVRELQSNEKVYMLQNKHDEFYKEIYQGKPVRFFWSDMIRAQLYSSGEGFFVVDMELTDYIQQYLKDSEEDVLLCLNRDDVNYPITLNEYRMLDRIAVTELDK